MAIYTYAGNKRAGDFTSALKLNDGTTLRIGDSANIDADDLSQLSANYTLLPGSVVVDLSTFPYLRSSTENQIVAGNVQSGTELAYSEVTVDSGSLTNTSFSTIPNLSAIEFSVTNRPVKVELFIPLVQVGGATSIFGVQISSPDGLTVYASTEIFLGDAFTEQPCTLSRRIVTPGNYTMIARARVSASNYSIKSGTYLTPTYLSAVSL